MKWRALRLDTGNFSWGSEAVTRKTRLLDVVYNASNNELVRTQTLVKSAIVQVDAAPFKQWYLQHYGVEVGRKKKTAAKKDSVEVIVFEIFLLYMFVLYDISFQLWWPVDDFLSCISSIFKRLCFFEYLSLKTVYIVLKLLVGARLIVFLLDISCVS